MKKQLMLLVLLISVGSLCAQTSQNEKTRPNYYQQGEWMLSLSPKFSWAKRGEVQGTGLTLGGLWIDSRITAGKFIKDKLFVGSSFAYRGAPLSDVNSYNMKGGLLTRYYVTKRGISPFIEVNGGSYRENFFRNEFTLLAQHGMYLGARIGAEYRVGRLGIEGSWGKEWRSGRNDFLLPFDKRAFQFSINFHF